LRRPKLPWILSLTVATLVGAGVVGAIWWITSAGSSGSPRGGRVDIRYEPGAPEVVRSLQRSGVLARAVATVNDEVALPRDLHVRVLSDQAASRVGASGPEYEPGRHTVYLPWSFVEQSRGELGRLKLLAKATPAQLDRIAQSAMTFVLYHELAHGLIDVLDLPVVASEEQMADSFASVLAIVSRGGGESVPLSAAVLGEARSEAHGAPALADYADDHGFDRSRAFDEVCLVYGSAPHKFSNLVQQGFLPSGRARVCPFDYQRTLRSWNRLLQPWLTHKEGVASLGS
jgi:hypothetical protein